MLLPTMPWNKNSDPGTRSLLPFQSTGSWCEITAMRLHHSQQNPFTNPWRLPSPGDSSRDLFLSPNLWKGHFFTIPKRSQAEMPGVCVCARLPLESKPKMIFDDPKKIGRSWNIVLFNPGLFKKTHTINPRRHVFFFTNQPQKKHPEIVSNPWVFAHLQLAAQVPNR